MNASGPRTCVFRIGGTIPLTSELIIRNPYLTIAGQTAPGGGILLKGTDAANGQMISIRTHDVILRYLRIRSGAHGSPGRGQVNIDLAPGAHDVIVDHVSTSWSLDENILLFKNVWHGTDPATVPDIYNITVQRSLIAEGLHPHSTGLPIGGEFDPPDIDAADGVYNISIHKNAFVHNDHRNPGLSGPRADFINNVVYNWGSKASETHRGAVVDIIGNYWKPGPFSDPLRIWVHNAFDKSTPTIPYPDPSIYVQGNVSPPNYLDSLADNHDMWLVHYSEKPLPARFWRNVALPPPPIPVKILSAHAAYDSVLGDVGANARLDCKGNWVANSDAVDRRLLGDVLNGDPQISIGQNTLATHENQVGGYPPIASRTPCPDADHDGMPDAWERQNGLNPADARDARQDADGDGYTNLEAYLNGKTLSGGTPPPPPSPTPAPAPTPAPPPTPLPTPPPSGSDETGPSPGRVESN